MLSIIPLIPENTYTVQSVLYILQSWILNNIWAGTFKCHILGPLYSFFVLLVMSTLGFKLQIANMQIAESNIMYVPWGSPLVLHIANLLTVNIVGRQFKTRAQCCHLPYQHTLTICIGTIRAIHYAMPTCLSNNHNFLKQSMITQNWQQHFPWLCYSAQLGWTLILNYDAKKQVVIIDIFVTKSNIEIDTNFETVSKVPESHS